MSSMLEKNQKKIRFSDIFIASYPRSGNTWTRRLISDVVLQKHGFQTDTKLPIETAYIIPDIYRDDIDKLDPRIQLDFRLIKTHESYPEISGKFLIQNGQPKVIYIFRNPIDVLCSYYHFKKVFSKPENRIEVGLDKFCLDKITEWESNLQSHLIAKKKTPLKVMFICYEGLHNHPFETLDKVMNFLNIEANKRMYQKAINNQQFKKVQKIYQEPDFYRKGRIGSALEELSQATISVIEERTSVTYQKAKQVADSNVSNFNLEF